ncbi:flagellar export protein FliJ [Oceanospirillum linum]|uniref:Flagellar FliJ protein n=1 Tax=Oceanospirillum linum TaxID=966 RepID=A0A1T1HFJ2_OCELI|nr:flagellar export protein FliJ [Oceanospirillum linum]OOV88572.1 flagellar export protein FliJ [Oceanospirillum linum]SEF61324.1 flagellar FliJ protein [Oleiphilus messinensis]SMP07125.1 flagellar FliJ protein [Oceanospirillum linum]
MKRSERLKNIMTMAEKKERDAVNALGYLNTKVSNEELKQKQLLEYELEYHEKIIETGRTGINGATLRTYFGFMDKLSHAANQQVGHIAELEQQVDQVQQYWFKARGKLRAFESLVERAEAQEAAEADKLEQKALDEFAALAYLRRKYSDK